MTNVPINKKLYSKVKLEAKRKFAVWPSAYASSWLVREYKKRNGKYYKDNSKPKSKIKSRKYTKPKTKSRKYSKLKTKPKEKSKTKTKSRKYSKSKAKPKTKPKTKSIKYSKSKAKSKAKSKTKTKSRNYYKSKEKKTVNMRFSSSRKSGLSRWFAEQWIDVCKLPKIVPCGRKNASKGKYPYCRPRYKISSKTPVTARSISKSEIKRRCSNKRRNPNKKVSSLKKVNNKKKELIKNNNKLI